MQVVLTQDVKKLGQAHDVVAVKPGYARNFLIPQNLAVLATPTAILMAEKIQSERIKKAEELKSDAKAIAGQLKGVVLSFKKKARGEKLYAAISEKHIIEALSKEHKVEIAKDMVIIEDPIKTLGEHTVKLHLAEDIDVKIKVKVEEEK